MSHLSLDNNSQLKSRLQDIPIAIIGMACLLPQARNLRQFWHNVVNEVDCITDVPPSRWAIDDYYDPDPTAPDKTYCKRGGFLSEVDFDPMEFGLPPNILEVTDVAQLLSLLVARDVLEDAGYGEASGLDREKVGIVLGVGGGQKLITPLTARLQYPVWQKVLRQSGVSEEDARIIIEKIKKAYIPWEENSFPGMLGNVISGRIANRLNLGGINCVVDAACAGSLAALKMALGELLEYRGEVMITGGVDADNSIFMYMCFSKTPAFTKTDRCRPFDTDTDGMMVGEGIGMVALKRLEDAERDNDRIYAVIRGIGASSDGRFSSIYNPRPAGQAMALRRAYRDAGIRPSTVGLVEAHGTGTMAGDPAEVAALKDVFCEGETQRQHIALGSIKSQIGHTKAAAGAAGLVKAALALHHKILPPTINVTKPLAKLDLEHSPFYLNTETRPWFRAADNGPRRAAVSSFGFGGTNFHVVLEEYEKAGAAPYRMHDVPRTFLFFAEDPEALIQECNHAIQRLESESGGKHYRDLAAAGKHIQIPTEAARFGFVSASRSQACELLKRTAKTLQTNGREASWELPGGVTYRRTGMDLEGGVVALFSGQGSQYRNMGKELVYNFPPLMDAYREMDRLFLKDGRPALSQKVYPIPVFEEAHRKRDEEELRRTEHAQPAIGAFCAGLYRVLEQAGFQPDMVAGHSFGELTALWAAKVLSDQDFCALAVARGRAMAAPDDPDFDAGTMLAIIGDFQAIQGDIRNFPTVTVANFNSKKETVVAGPAGDLAAVRKALREKPGCRLVPLPVSAAFHTPLVRHAQKPFAKAVGAVAFRQAQCPVYSNSTGKPYPCDPEAIQKGLQEHMLKPVLFQEEIENIYQDGGALFVEFGPRGILTKLVDNILADKPHVAVALNPLPGKGGDRQLREAVVKLRVAGLSLQDIDPWHMERPVAETKAMSPAAVKLTGANYVSEHTRGEFTKALNDGWRIRPADAPQDMPAASVPQENRPAGGHPHAVHGADTASFSPPPPAAASPVADYQRVPDNIRHSLELFYKHQGETLELHRQYLANHKEYAQAFFELMGRQYALLGGDPPAAVPDSVEQSMVLFHTHQAETLRVHDEYLKDQAQISKLALDVGRGSVSVLGEAGPSPVEARASARSAPLAAPDLEVPGVDYEPVLKPGAQTVSLPEQRPLSAALPEPTPAAAGPGFEALTRSSLEVVSDKTGYPVEMLELDMEMEADLGIDSIKRVEILGTIMELYPDLPELN
ncbi:MAG: acyltransferase domain-containing protein, partial [Desulfobacterales bacterium]|nr:acyltransferase domain-containing protein [Desulfobacterales bacterium]